MSYKSQKPGRVVFAYHMMKIDDAREHPAIRGFGGSKALCFLQLERSPGHAECKPEEPLESRHEQRPTPPVSLRLQG